MILHTIHPIKERKNIITTPFSLSYVCAGFPSPAENYLDKALDLNELMINHPEATFFVRVSGDSMIGAGICHNDILVVDRACEPKSNDVVVALVSGEFTVKRWIKKGRSMYLQPENINYHTIKITEEMNFEIWGVVTYAIHSLHAPV